jgi:hypothetical protein
MSDVNPYAPPQSPIDTAPAAGTPGTGHTPTILWHLQRTKPWVMLIGILGFIFAGLMALGSIVMVIVAVAQSGGYTSDEEIVALVAVGFGYLLFAAIYFLLAAQIVGYGRRIGLAIQTGRTEHVEEALDCQRRFWKTFGVVTIIFIGLVLLAFTIGLVAAVATNM